MEDFINNLILDIEQSDMFHLGSSFGYHRDKEVAWVTAYLQGLELKIDMYGPPMLKEKAVFDHFLGELNRVVNDYLPHRNISATQFRKLVRARIKKTGKLFQSNETVKQKVAEILAAHEKGVVYRSKIVVFPAV